MIQIYKNAVLPKGKYGVNLLKVVYYFLSTQVTNDLISICTPWENCFTVLNNYHMFNVELANILGAYLIHAIS